jgi:hypothetical protein
MYVNVLRLSLLKLGGVANSDSKIGNNALPAIWGLAEISVATITACLPMMHALYSIWLPFIFDIATAPSSNKKEILIPRLIPSRHIASHASAAPRKSAVPEQTGYHHSRGQSSGNTRREREDCGD